MRVLRKWLFLFLFLVTCAESEAVLKKEKPRPVDDEKTIDPSLQGTKMTVPKRIGINQSRFEQRVAAYDNASGEKKLQLKKQIIAVIEDQLSLTQMLKLIGKKAPRRFPYDYVLFKTALIFNHLGLYEKAQILIKRFRAQFSDHPLIDDAEQLYLRIRARYELSTNQIGVILPLSGLYSNYGKLIQASILLGLKKESSLKLIFKDTRGTPEGAIEAVNTLFYKDKVIAILGPCGIYESTAAAIRAQQLGIPIVTLTTKDKITEIGEYVFRNWVSKRMLIQALVNYTYYTLNYKRYGILYPADYYGEEMMNLFWEEVEKIGGKVTAVSKYRPDEIYYDTPVTLLVGKYHLSCRKDIWKYYRSYYTGKISKIKSDSKAFRNLPPVVEFEALFIPDYPKNLSILLQFVYANRIELKTSNDLDPEKLKIKNFGVPPQLVHLLGADGWNDKTFVEKSDIEKIVQNAIFADAFFLDSNNNQVKEFVQLYQTVTKNDPSYSSALAYDMIRMVIEAMDSKKPQTREEFREALLSIKDFNGATGVTTMLSNRDVFKKVFLLTVSGKDILELPYEFKSARDKVGDKLEKGKKPEEKSILFLE